MEYTRENPSYGAVFDVKTFKAICKDGGFTDYDGFGFPEKEGKHTREIEVKPSKVKTIPKEVTHILWFNR